jgi:hypothetical protein
VQVAAEVENVHPPLAGRMPPRRWSTLAISAVGFARLSRRRWSGDVNSGICVWMGLKRTVSQKWPQQLSESRSRAARLSFIWGFSFALTEPPASSQSRSPVSRHDPLSYRSWAQSTSQSVRSDYGYSMLERPGEPYLAARMDSSYLWKLFLGHSVIFWSFLCVCSSLLIRKRRTLYTTNHSHKGPGTTIKDPNYSRESTNKRGREIADCKVRQALYQGSSEGETYVPYTRGARQSVHP